MCLRGFQAKCSLGKNNDCVDFLSIFIIIKNYFTSKFHSRLISVDCKFEIKRTYTEF